MFEGMPCPADPNTMKLVETRRVAMCCASLDETCQILKQSLAAVLYYAVSTASCMIHPDVPGAANTRFGWVQPTLDSEYRLRSIEMMACEKHAPNILQISQHASVHFTLPTLVSTADASSKTSDVSALL